MPFDYYCKEPLLGWAESSVLVQFLCPTSMLPCQKLETRCDERVIKEDDNMVSDKNAMRDCSSRNIDIEKEDIEKEGGVVTYTYFHEVADSLSRTC